MAGCQGAEITLLEMQLGFGELHIYTLCSKEKQYLQFSLEGQYFFNVIENLRVITANCHNRRRKYINNLSLY